MLSSNDSNVVPGVLIPFSDAILGYPTMAVFREQSTSPVSVLHLHSFVCRLQDHILEQAASSHAKTIAKV